MISEKERKELHPFVLELAMNIIANSLKKEIKMKKGGVVIPKQSPPNFISGGIVSGGPRLDEIPFRIDSDFTLHTVGPHDVAALMYSQGREFCNGCEDYKVKKKIIHEVKNYFIDECGSRWNGRTCPDCQKTSMIAYKRGERELRKLSVVEEMKKEIADLKEELKEFKGE